MTAESMRHASEKFTQACPIPPLRIDHYEQELERTERLTPVVKESFDKARAVRADHGVVFYIAGALTGVSKETKQRYTQLSELIAEQGERSNDREGRMFGYAPHLHGTDPVQHPDVTPREVRDIDFLWATVLPDGHFNFLDPVAHGNAVEAGWAETSRIPSVHIVPESMRTSRLVRGMLNVIGTIEYADFEADALPQAQLFLEDVGSIIRHEESLTRIRHKVDIGDRHFLIPHI